MIGLGCGARSYTRNLHYAFEYAVDRQQTSNIIDRYINTSYEEFCDIRHGFQLDQEEQQRRFILQSVLQVSGLNCNDYEKTFGTHALQDFPALNDLMDHGLGVLQNDVLSLTEAGLERSDAIGPWLFSEPVKEKMRGFQWT